MRVAVATEDGVHVAGHFGRIREYQIYEIESKEQLIWKQENIVIHEEDIPKPDANGNPVSEEKLTELAGQIKSLLDVAQNLTDETLAPLIRSTMSKYGLSMNDEQLSTLLSFFRSAGEEKEKEQSLASKLEGLQDTVTKVTETASKAARFLRTVRRSFHEVVLWFSHVKDLFH